MNSTIKGKKKPHQLTRVLSDPEVHKHPSSSHKKLLGTSRSDLFEPHEKSRAIFTSHDSTSIRNINLQIPSVNSPSSLSISNSQTIGSSNKKKSACIKGFSSKLNLKSPKGIKSRKAIKETDKVKGLENEISGLKGESEKSENLILETLYLSEELRKAIDENKKLKKSLEEESIKEDSIDDLMKSFKTRLYKLLYE